MQHCCKTDNKDILSLKGKVRFSQRITNFHSVEVTVNKNNRQIISVNCDCTASEGKTCSHSAALLFKIVKANKCEYIGTSCTDKACLWNRSTQENVLPDTASNIRGKKETTVSSSTSFDTHQQLLDHLDKSALKELSAIPGTILNQVKTAKPAQTVPNKPIPPHHGLHDITIQCSACLATYEKYVKLSTAKNC